MELRDVVRRLKAAQGIRKIHEDTGVPIHLSVIIGQTGLTVAELESPEFCPLPVFSHPSKRRLHPLVMLKIAMGGT